MKLLRLIQESTFKDRGFATTKTDVQPDTGQVTWNVEYDSIKNADKQIDRAVFSLESVVKKRSDDEKLVEILNQIKTLRREFRRHVSRKYSF